LKKQKCHRNIAKGIDGLGSKVYTGRILVYT